MRADGPAAAPPSEPAAPARWLSLAAGVIAGVAGALALYGAESAGERLAIAVALGFGTIALAGLAATRRSRQTLRSLASAAAEVTAGGPRRIADTGGEVDAVSTLINRMADDAERTLVALRGERDLLGSVLDSMTQGVIALDADERITLINPAARRIFALPGVPIGERFADQVKLPEALALIADNRTDSTAEFTTSAGILASARVTAQRSGDGRLVVVDDVTAIRRLETIRRDFIANVSHELRTPVSVIRANAETLQGGGKDDPAFSGRLIDGLHRNAERLARIIADLLDLSRLDAGHYRLDRTEVDVAAAVAQAAAAVEHLASKRGTTIAVAVAPGITAVADVKALDQVLVNLLDNAIKYAPADGHVTVRAVQRAEVVRIEVADDGPGIAPDHRDRIFERFYRVDPGRSRDQGGTGLGLSIVKHLAESMGGSVGLEANRPTGSVFWCALPRSDAGDSRSVASASPS
ncbi:MAG: PAS domain-containing protein [Myxococcales bacterium]|nr:PAS domain-containing protein [Myxococcales bacterium]